VHNDGSSVDQFNSDIKTFNTANKRGLMKAVFENGVSAILKTNAFKSCGVGMSASDEIQNTVLSTNADGVEIYAANNAFRRAVWEAFPYLKPIEMLTRNKTRSVNSSLESNGSGSQGSGSQGKVNESDDVAESEDGGQIVIENEFEGMVEGIIDMPKEDAAIEAKKWRDPETKSDILNVSVKHLCAPSDDLLVRGIDDRHVREIKRKIAKEASENTEILPVMLVPGSAWYEGYDLAAFQPDDAKKNVVQFATLGGNHARKAIQELVEAITDEELLKAALDSPIFKVNVRIYIDLTWHESLHLAVKHNKVIRKKMNWFDQVSVLRHHFQQLMQEKTKKQITEQEELDVPIATDEIKDFVFKVYGENLSKAVSEIKNLEKCKILPRGFPYPKSGHPLPLAFVIFWL
jgi:hypothetical protein